eukprot:Pgem_evm1s17184
MNKDRIRVQEVNNNDELLTFFKTLNTSKKMLLTNCKWQDWQKLYQQKPEHERSKHQVSAQVDLLINFVENKLVQLINSYLKNEFGDSTSTLMFDGLIFPKPLTEEKLRKIEKEVLTFNFFNQIKKLETFSFKLTIKPFETVNLDLDWFSDELNPLKCLDSTFDYESSYDCTTFINDFCSKGYENGLGDAINTFQKNCGKVLAFIGSGGGSLILGKIVNRNTKDIFIIPLDLSQRKVVYQVGDPEKPKYKTIKLSEFIANNEYHRMMHVYNDRVSEVNPFGEPLVYDKEVFNYFVGWKVKLISQENLDQHIIDHCLAAISMVAPNFEDCLLKWLWFIMHVTNEQSKLVMVLYGPRQIIKSTILKMVRNFFHKSNAITTSDYKAIFGTFNSLAAGKSFIGLEDISQHDKRQNLDSGKFKSNVTEISKTINGKGEKQYELDQVTNYMLSTNFLTCLDDADYREFIVSSVKNPESHEFYKELNHIIDNPERLSHFASYIHYKYINEPVTLLDLKKFPKTPAMLLKDKIINHQPIRFLEHLIKNQNQPFNVDNTISLSALYDHYKVWCYNNDEKVKYSLIKFQLDIEGFINIKNDKVYMNTLRLDKDFKRQELRPLIINTCLSNMVPGKEYTIPEILDLFINDCNLSATSIGKYIGKDDRFEAKRSKNIRKWVLKPSDRRLSPTPPTPPSD